MMRRVCRCWGFVAGGGVCGDLIANRLFGIGSHLSIIGILVCCKAWYNAHVCNELKHVVY